MFGKPRGRRSLGGSPPRGGGLAPAAALLWVSSIAAWAEAPVIRVMTFNASMNRPAEGELAADLASGTDSQIRRVAQVIQALSPDILLMNEFDNQGDAAVLDLFHENYLEVSQGGQAPVAFPHRFTATVNTGLPSGHDLDNNGSVDTTPGDESYGNDCHGFGVFPGQYGMAVFSKHPIAASGVRTFQELRWRDLPDADLPPTWYSAEELEDLRLSSKSHWDLPIDIDGRIVHLLASHPTPPAFDAGQEQRNQRRNHDEIRFWAEFVDVEPRRSDWIRDDRGGVGGLGGPARFVILGDQNADPDEGSSRPGAIAQLLDHPRIASGFVPVGSFSGDDTAVFNGRLRVDYVLPSRAGLHVVDGAVVWPRTGEPLANLLGSTSTVTSDHRPVYLDLALVPLIEEAVRDLQVGVEDGVFHLRWRIQDGVAYGVEWNDRPDGEEDAWQRGPSDAVLVEGDRASFRDPVQPGRRFYRIVAWFDE